MQLSRRSFFRTIAIGTAAVYLRLAPEKLQEVPVDLGWDRIVRIQTDFGELVILRHPLFNDDPIPKTLPLPEGP